MDAPFCPGGSLWKTSSFLFRSAIVLSYSWMLITRSAPASGNGLFVRCETMLVCTGCTIQWTRSSLPGDCKRAARHASETWAMSISRSDSRSAGILHSRVIMQSILVSRMPCAAASRQEAACSTQPLRTSSFEGMRSVAFSTRIGRAAVLSLPLKHAVTSRRSAVIVEAKAGARKVAVLGAAGGIGQPLALLLKMQPYVAELALYDIANTVGVAADLSHCNTSVKVREDLMIWTRCCALHRCFTARRALPISELPPRCFSAQRKHDTDQVGLG